jgi:hypothetical protein
MMMKEKWLSLKGKSMLLIGSQGNHTHLISCMRNKYLMELEIGLISISVRIQSSTLECTNCLKTLEKNKKKEKTLTYYAKS